ncbi:AraC family transcriptional regulator [Maribacter sp.]|nr:AraC family transcriptional regulator [Maribacter sp.]
MKTVVQKSPIPHNHVFVAKHLKEAIFDPNWHFHSEYQLFLVLKGNGTRFIGDHVQPFKPGNITFTGPDLPHLWRSDLELSNTNKQEKSEGIVVYFNEKFMGESLLQKEETIRIRRLFKKSLRGLQVNGATRKITQKKLVKLLDLKGFDSVLELLQILNILSQTNDLEPLASPGYTNTLKEGDTDRMNRVYAYVMKNFTKKMSILELAELTNMTPTSFSRYFRVHANKSFSEFVSEIRIGHACKLLIEKRMSASQACYESGYRTLSNYNRQFKALTQQTPSEYKRLYDMD